MTTPVASTAILALGLAYLLAANALWAPFLGIVDTKLGAALGKVRWPGPVTASSVRWSRIAAEQLLLLRSCRALHTGIA